MNIYQSTKYAVTDALCAAGAPFLPDSFNTYCTRFIDGFFVTVELLLLSCIAGGVLAIGLTLVQLCRYRLFSRAVTCYSYIFRGTPLLVQLWIVYFGLGSFGATYWGVFWPFFRDGWNIGLFVLTLNTAAYVAEILRGALVNIDKGQMEAAKACGLSWFLAMRRIMLPQAFRIAWPAYGNEVILLMKGSALVSTITVLDLMGQTRTVFARTYALDVYFYSAVLYLLLAGLITGGFKLIERRWSY